MTRYILLVLLTTITIAKSNAQSRIEMEQESIKSVVVNIFNALSDLDTAKLRKYCTADVLVLESGQIWNFDSLALRITSRKSLSSDFKRVNRFDFIESRIDGKTAYLSYFNYATISFGGKTTDVKWIETAILKREAKGWKMALLHSTELDRKSKNSGQ